jgi:hypothetical protein
MSATRSLIFCANPGRRGGARTGGVVDVLDEHLELVERGHARVLVRGIVQRGGERVAHEHGVGHAEDVVDDPRVERRARGRGGRRGRGAGRRVLDRPPEEGFHSVDLVGVNEEEGKGEGE